MSHEGGLWLMVDDELHSFIEWEFPSEYDLRLFIETHPEVLGDVLVIDHEIATAGHGWIDLLAIDSAGNLWAIELKKGHATRRIMEQILGYSAWARTATLNDLKGLYARRRGGASLEVDYEMRFRSRLPGRAEMGLVVAVLAAKVDEHAHCQLAELEGSRISIRAYEYAIMHAAGVQAMNVRRVHLRAHRQPGAE